MCVCVCVCVCVCEKSATVVDGDPKAHFSIATTPKALLPAPLYS